MGSPQDWETVASFWHRAGKIPHVIIHREFAEEIVPSAEVPDLPSVTLERAADSLCGLFDREFEHAQCSQRARPFVGRPIGHRPGQARPLQKWPRAE